MADVKKIATESYGNALKELGAVAENLVVLDARPGRCHQNRHLPEGISRPVL